MSERQKLYLRDILEHIQRIETAVNDGKDTFFASTLHQDAVIRNFEVIGEIVKRLDVELTSQQPDLIWADYAGFRDILIHQYDKMLVEIVWESAKNDLEPLRVAVKALLSSLPDDETPG